MNIQGRKKFEAQIAALPGAMKAEIRKALEVSAEETTDLMRRFAPVKSGALRRSIDYTFGHYRPDNSNVRGVEAGGGSAGELTVTLHAGDEVAWYASLVEFGTAPHTNRGLFDGTHHPGSRAAPFFFPGFRFGKKRARARLARAVRAGAKKAFGK